MFNSKIHLVILIMKEIRQHLNGNDTQQKRKASSDKVSGSVKSKFQVPDATRKRLIEMT